MSEPRRIGEILPDVIEAAVPFEPELSVDDELDLMALLPAKKQQEIALTAAKHGEARALHELHALLELATTHAGDNLCPRCLARVVRDDPAGRKYGFCTACASDLLAEATSATEARIRSLTSFNAEKKRLQRTREAAGDTIPPELRARKPATCDTCGRTFSRRDGSTTCPQCVRCLAHLDERHQAAQREEEPSPSLVTRHHTPSLPQPKE